MTNFPRIGDLPGTEHLGLYDTSLEHEHRALDEILRAEASFSSPVTRNGDRVASKAQTEAKRAPVQEREASKGGGTSPKNELPLKKAKGFTKDGVDLLKQAADVLKGIETSVPKDNRGDTVEYGAGQASRAIAGGAAMAGKQIGVIDDLLKGKVESSEELWHVPTFAKVSESSPSKAASYLATADDVMEGDVERMMKKYGYSVADAAAIEKAYWDRSAGETVAMQGGAAACEKWLAKLVKPAK